MFFPFEFLTQDSLNFSLLSSTDRIVFFFTLLFLVFQLALLLLQFNLARSREFCPDFSELFELVADKAIFGGAK